MKYEVGQIFILEDYSRFGIIANLFSINENSHILLFPLSTATYLAGADDFIIVCDPSINEEPMICETWNPLLIDKTFLKKTKYVGTLQEDFLSIYKKYLYYKHMGLKTPDLSVFTGPPIKSSSDIRLEFRKTEFNLFYNLRKEVAEKLY